MGVLNFSKIHLFFPKFSLESSKETGARDIIDFKDLRKEVFIPKEKYYYKINDTVSKHISELTYLFLTDKRIIYDNKILKDKFNDLIKNGYSMVDGNEVMLNILGLGNKLSKQEPIFLRNLFMNLIYSIHSITSGK